LDEQHKPTPPGTYRIVVETNQEHGVYAKQAGTIACGNDPASLTLSATANFETVSSTQARSMQTRWGPWTPSDPLFRLPPEVPSPLRPFNQR
jgi:hypothetical protein